MRTESVWVHARALGTLCIGTFAFACVVSVVHAADGDTPPWPLNDTGQLSCYDMAGTVVACNNQEVPGQDAAVGRDFAAIQGQLPRSGGGSGGFDYTKISLTGEELPESAQPGSDPDSWACTRDNVTGLVWEVKTDDGEMRDRHWNYVWFNPDDATNGGYPGEEVGVQLACGFTMACNTQAYVEYVNSIDLCGRGDWRLPRLVELSGLANLASTDVIGAIDHDYFFDDGYGSAWTSDSAMEPEDGAWFVNFDDGHVEVMPKGGMTGIRLVSGDSYQASDAPTCGDRENPQIPSATGGAFVDEGEGLIRDTRTDLVWERCSLGQDFAGEEEDQVRCDGEAQPMNWEQALQEVAERNRSGYRGHDDWRLPNIKELSSLLEPRCAAPAIDAAVFPQSSFEGYWSSTTVSWFGNESRDQGWGMMMEFGGTQSMPKDSEMRVRLVRGGGPYDGYQGAPSYSVGGTLSGMVGAGVGLNLQTGGGTDEALEVASNGTFAFGAGLVDGETYTVTLIHPPVPSQDCAIEHGAGVIDGADVGDIEVVCQVPDPAQIAVVPGTLEIDVVQDASAQGSVAVENTGGGILHWSIDTAYAPAAVSARSTDEDMGCTAASGAIIHDDGSVENGIKPNPYWEAGGVAVDRFTPDSYPASINTVCIGLASGDAATTTLDFEIVVFDDNGPDGTPGAELTSLAVTAEDLPSWPVSEPVWYTYDLSALYTTIDSGSVYVGVRWHSGAPNVFLLVDQSSDRPVGYADGYFWNWGDGGQWEPLQNRVSTDYRALFVRATIGAGQPQPTGCDAPSAVPWLSVSPHAGSTDASDSSDVTVTVNANGLERGQYSALLCVDSDADNGPVHVPVTMTVTGIPPTVEKSFVPATVVVDEDSVATITLSNPNEVEAHLVEPFTDVLPDGLEIRDASTTCGIVVDDAAPNRILEGSVSLPAGMSIPGNGSCVLEITVRAAGAGGYVNAIPAGALRTDLGASVVAASATLTVTPYVAPPPSIVVDPGFMYFVAAAGDATSAPLAIGNVGGSVLRYVIDEGAYSSASRSSYLSARLRKSESDLLVAGTKATLVADAGGGEARRGTVFIIDDNAMISQMQDNTPGDQGVSCGAKDTSTAPNSWWRRFYFNEHDGIGSMAAITAVTVSSGGNSPVGLPVSINLYTVDHGVPIDTIPTAELVPIGGGAGTIDGSLTSFTIPVTATVDDTVAKDLVVEYHTEGNANGGQFFPGANSSPETHPTFIQADECGIVEPTKAVEIGYPGFHLTMVVHLQSSTPPPSCEQVQDIPWLGATPVSGAIQAGEQDAVQVVADAGALSEGIHLANLCVSSNDPVQPLITVPVSFVVTPRPVDDTIFCDGFEEGGCGGRPPQEDLVRSGPLNLAIPIDHDGLYLDFVTGAVSTQPTPSFDFAVYRGQGLSFYWTEDAFAGANGGSAAGPSGAYRWLQAGDVVGPGMAFSAVAYGGHGTGDAFHSTSDGYLGVRFFNEVAGRVNYGYVHLRTTAPDGFPASIIEYAYDPSGRPVMVH